MQLLSAQLQISLSSYVPSVLPEESRDKSRFSVVDLVDCLAVVTAVVVVAVAAAVVAGLV